MTGQGKLGIVRLVHAKGLRDHAALARPRKWRDRRDRDFLVLHGRLARGRLQHIQIGWLVERPRPGVPAVQYQRPHQVVVLDVLLALVRVHLFDQAAVVVTPAQVAILHLQVRAALRQVNRQALEERWRRVVERLPAGAPVHVCHDHRPVIRAVIVYLHEPEHPTGGGLQLGGGGNRGGCRQQELGSQKDDPACYQRREPRSHHPLPTSRPANRPARGVRAFIISSMPVEVLVFP